MSIIILTGCVGPNSSVSQIGGLEGEAIIRESLYDVEQEGAITLEALEKEFRNNKMNLVNVSEDGATTAHYHLEEKDDEENITILVDTVTSPDNPIISEIVMSDSKDLSQHPMVKIIASVMGEEKLLTWVAEQEGRVKGADKSNDIIMEVLPLERCYLSFEYWPGSEEKTLNFLWALKPHISMAFEEIARQLENQGMMTTGYIEGLGGSTLTATNSDYYLLTRRGYNTEKKIDPDIGQAVSYRVMHDIKSGDYSIQLYGYMMEDLSYITEVETMPGLDELTQMMGMGQEDFLAITGAINKELTEARKLQNENLRRDTYVEGSVGAYHYTINVPSGWGTYRFTVLIEEK